MVITVYEDNLGDNGTLLIDRYIDFFMNNLQSRFEIDGTTYLEGGNYAYAFLDNLSTNILNTPDFKRWNSDDKLDKLHQQIKENGMKLCPLNFYTLCQYILHIIKEQYFLLLKPTINDIVEELSDVKSITFTNGDGKEIKSDNSELIKLVLDSIKPVENPTYETDRLVRLDKLGGLIDKALLQSSFVYNVAIFLKEYFKDYPRRANCCIVSAIEQKLILYMLYFFGLAPAPLTDSRFRQLVKYFKEHRYRVSLANIPNVGYTPMEIIKYKDWKNGINLNQIKYPINRNDIFHFSTNTKIEIQHRTVSLRMQL